MRENRIIFDMRGLEYARDTIQRLVLDGIAVNYSTLPTAQFRSLVEITLINQQKSVHVTSLYRFIQQCCNIRKLTMVNCGQTYMNFSGSAL